MGDYIDIDYIETELSTTFDSTTSPTDDQINKWITVGEGNFEEDVGVFTVDTYTSIVQGIHDGLILPYTPINSITSIKRSSGAWDRNFDDNEVDSDDYRVYDNIRGKVQLKLPYPRTEFQVVYSAGYSSVDMPERLKKLVFLYIVREIFKNTLFSTDGNVSGKTETIDVDVYKEVIGGNPYEGTKAIDMLINDEKGYFKSKLKTYLG